MKKNRALIITIYVVSIAMIIIQALPYLISAAYSFPLQDDFFNTGTVLGVMAAENKNALSAAVSLAYKGYFEYRGYYFSLFLIYLADGVLQCRVIPLRIWQVTSLLLFYSILVWMLYTVSVRIFRLEKHISIVMTAVAFSFFVSLFYFVNNESLFWLCASTVYQMPCTCLFLYVIVYVIGIDKKSGIPQIIACILLGFLTGGASVNVAALACVAACQLIYWGIVIKHKTLYSCICGIPVLVGGFLNIIAPGNRLNTDIDPIAGKLLTVAKGSVMYEVDRIRMFATEYPIFWVLIVSIIVLTFISKSYHEYDFRLPLLYIALCFVGIIVTIFPVQWANGVEAYEVYERCIIISDWATGLMMFFACFYLSSYIKRILRIKGISDYRISAVMAGVVACAIGVAILLGKDNVASKKLYIDLRDGKVQAYSNWVVDIIHEVQESDEDIVRIKTNEVEDETCMANAFYHIGEYEINKVTGNTAMAEFYGKRAVYIITDGE